jgi:hypothetical protein
MRVQNILQEITKELNMASRYSREKNPKNLLLKKNQEYRRDEIIEGLQHPADYRGISHYITPDKKKIYSFFYKDNFDNEWKPPVFKFKTKEATKPDNIKDEGQTRYVFYSGNDNENAKYEYLGTTTDEISNDGTIIWEIP